MLQLRHGHILERISVELHELYFGLFPGQHWPLQLFRLPFWSLFFDRRNDVFKLCCWNVRAVFRIICMLELLLWHVFNFHWRQLVHKLLGGLLSIKHRENQLHGMSWRKHLQYDWSCGRYGSLPFGYLLGLSSDSLLKLHCWNVFDCCICNELFKLWHWLLPSKHGPKLVL